MIVCDSADTVSSGTCAGPPESQFKVGDFGSASWRIQAHWHSIAFVSSRREIRRQRPAAQLIGVVLKACRCTVRPMDLEGACNLPHLPVEDQSWAAAVEISGDEACLTTEPQPGLDGEPED